MICLCQMWKSEGKTFVCRVVTSARTAGRRRKRTAVLTLMNARVCHARRTSTAPTPWARTRVPRAIARVRGARDTVQINARPARADISLKTNTVQVTRCFFHFIENGVGPFREWGGTF